MEFQESNTSLIPRRCLPWMLAHGLQYAYKAATRELAGQLGSRDGAK